MTKVFITIFFLSFSSIYALDKEIKSFINLEGAIKIYKSLPQQKEARLAIHDISFFGHKIILKEALVASVMANKTIINSPHGASVAQLIVDKKVGVLADQKIYSLTSGIYLDDYKKALLEWKENKIKIVNISVRFRSEAIVNLLNEFIKSGGIVIASSGNNAERFGKSLPSHYANFRGLTVGACDLNGQMESFSQYGEGQTILAPGSLHLVTTQRLIYDGSITEDPSILSDGFKVVPHFFGMTSAATPIVTGTILMALRLNPDLNQATINKLLLKSSRRVEARAVFDAQEFIQMVASDLLGRNTLL